MSKLTKEQIAQIQKEYEAITSFTGDTLRNLAKKHGLTLDELLDIISL